MWRLDCGIVNLTEARGAQSGPYARDVLAKLTDLDLPEPPSYMAVRGTSRWNLCDVRWFCG